LQINLRDRWQFDDWLAFEWLRTRRDTRNRYIGVIILLLMLAMFCVIDGRFALSLVSVLGMIVSAIYQLEIAPRRRARQAFEEAGPGQLALDLVLDDEGILSDSLPRQTWQSCRGYEESATHLLVRGPERGSATLIPKRLVSDLELAQLDELLRKRFGKPGTIARPKAVSRNQ
jgi:hypothetical protein